MEEIAYRTAASTDVISTEVEKTEGKWGVSVWRCPNS